MGGAKTTEYRPVRRILADQAQAFGDKPYMISIDQNDKVLSYRNLWRLGNRMAYFFRDRGLKANDRILMLSENSAEFLAVQRVGATIATANVEMNRAHIAGIISAIAPKLLLVQEGIGLTAENVIAHYGETLAPFKTPKQVIFVDSLPRTERGKLDRKSLTEAWKKSNPAAA